MSCGATSGSQWLHEIKHDGFRIRVTWTSCERLPARFPDPHARNVGLSTAGDHALALRGRESGLEQVEQHVDREAVFRTAQVEWHLAILPLTLVDAAPPIRSNPQARRLVPFWIRGYRRLPDLTVSYYAALSPERVSRIYRRRL